MRSTIIGERGVTRYQVKRLKDQAAAKQILETFLSNWKMSFPLKLQYKIVDLSIVYIPFWSTEAQVAAWVFGGAYDQRHVDEMRPVEKKILSRLSWNEAACDIAEFGIDGINLKQRSMKLLDIEALQADGMVFEPIESLEAHKKRAREVIKDEVINQAFLYHADSVHVRFMKERVSISYYPLWIARYRVKNRIFPVAIDAVSGLIRYGKAPGNIWLGATLMVFAMGFAVLFFFTIPLAFIWELGVAPIWLAMIHSPFLIAGLIALAILWYRFGGVIEIRREAKRIGGTPFWRSLSKVHKGISDSFRGLGIKSAN
jgi:hypothetical protein